MTDDEMLAWKVTGEAIDTLGKQLRALQDRLDKQAAWAKDVNLRLKNLEARLEAQEEFSGIKVGVPEVALPAEERKGKA